MKVRPKDIFMAIPLAIIIGAISSMVIFIVIEEPKEACVFVALAVLAVWAPRAINYFIQKSKP